MATDIHSNIYVLCERKKPGAREYEREVQVFEKTAALIHKFPVRREYWGLGLTVSNDKVLVLSCTDEPKYVFVVDVYEHDGGYVCSFGEGILKNARDITTVPDGRVMVIDEDDFCVHVFTEDGTQLNKFNINTKEDFYRVASHPAGEHVVIACQERGTDRPRVDIYTKDGEFVRAIALDEEIRSYRLAWITVTMEGHIAVAVRDERGNGKIIVL